MTAAQTPIAFRPYASDQERLDNILSYLQEKEPQNKVTYSDAIRYALFIADMGIEREQPKIEGIQR